jgi:hypothetical protein
MKLSAIPNMDVVSKTYQDVGFDRRGGDRAARCAKTFFQREKPKPRGSQQKSSRSASKGVGSDGTSVTRCAFRSSQTNKI